VLDQIVEQVRQMDALVGEIATASAEQSQGIDQINHAVSEMDKITQANAATAEESAAAARELSAQSGELSELVSGLGLLVGAGANRANVNPSTEFAPQEPSLQPRAAVLV
jgi:ABC-type transporter Mla subunit MlaD